MRIMIATIKSWNIERAYALQQVLGDTHEIKVVTKKEELTTQAVEAFAPDYLFLPHWSYFIPDEITSRWKCVVFHMTDLPYGRGGSPLQNLIVRGHKETKISAIQVTKKLDGGPVYMKERLSLDGSAQEIFIRCADIIFEKMIPVFLEKELQPVPQEGEPVVFRRRGPQDGRLTEDMTSETIYDYIRMLDAEGYPRAFLDYGSFRLDFEGAKLSEDGKEVEAKVYFRKREEEA